MQTTIRTQVVRAAQRMGCQWITTLIRAYQIGLSPFWGQHCRFYPSCSEYMMIAINRFGVFKGSFLGGKRLLRCHPFCVGGVDQVPEKKRAL